jgi:plastocyanin
VVEPEGTAAEPARSDRGGWGWLKLLRRSAIASVVVVVLINVFAGIIPPLLVFAVVWVGGVVWLRRAERPPAILLLVAFVAFLALSAPFVIPTLTVPASAGDFILNLASLLAALTGIAAAVAVIRGRGVAPGPARTIGLAAVAVFVAASAFSVVATVTYENATAREGDIAVVTKDIEFQDTSLAASAGEVSVYVDNEDATLHTFTIDELNVDLDIPASKSARVTFEAEPGTYEFYCVPHEDDMKGTIEIR